MTERGIFHLEDVLNIFNAGRRLLLFLTVTSIIGIVYLNKHAKQTLAKVFKNIFIAPILFFGFMIVSIYILKFDKVFVIFHEIFFDNDLWLLEWSDPLLIILPKRFFQVTAGIIGLLTMLQLTIIYIIGKRIKPSI